MWPILLKVLAIIGIVLACILGVVILLLLLILLCPITYKLEGSAHDKKYKVNIKIKYLFGLVRAGYSYPEPGNFYAKAAWFTIINTASDADKDNIKKKKKGASDASDADNNLTDNGFESLEESAAASEDSSASADKTLKKSKAEKKKEKAAKKAERKADKKNNDDEKNKENEKDKGPRILNPMYHIKRTWENFRFKVVTKVQYIIKDIKYYIALWEHDDTQALVRDFKKKLVKILKTIAPRKGKVNITFGTGSPDSTGKIFGIYCTVFTRWPKTFIVIPDFENKLFEGDIMVKGHFNLFSLAIQALPLIFGKKLRITRARFDAHADKKEASILKTQKKHEKILESLIEEYS